MNDLEKNYDVKVLYCDVCDKVFGERYCRERCPVWKEYFNYLDKKEE